MAELDGGGHEDRQVLLPWVVEFALGIAAANALPFVPWMREDGFTALEFSRGGGWLGLT